MALNFECEKILKYFLKFYYAIIDFVNLIFFKKLYDDLSVIIYLIYKKKDLVWIILYS